MAETVKVAVSPAHFEVEAGCPVISATEEPELTVTVTDTGVAEQLPLLTTTSKFTVEVSGVVMVVCAPGFTTSPEGDQA